MVTYKAPLTLIASRVANREIKSPSLKKLAREYIQSLLLSVFEQGNFTVITLQESSGRIVGVGTSKRMPTDTFDESIGYNISLVRAVEMAVDGFIDSIREAAPTSKEMNGTPKQALRA